jgi:drug/metabolite transporter (DMT)-like permease
VAQRSIGPLTAPETGSPTLGGFLIVLSAAAMFGTLGPLSRAAYDAGLEPLSFVTWRAAVGAMVVVAAVAWGLSRGRSLVALGALDSRGRIGLGVAALMGTTLNLAMFAAFERIPIALALLGFYTYPAMTAAVAVALGRERLDRPRAIALALATGGMTLVLAGQIEGGRLVVDPLGILLALSAAVSQTVFVTISRDAYRAVPAVQAMAVLLAVAAVVSGAVAIVGGAGTELAMPFSRPSILPLLLFAGVVAAAIPSLLFLTGIRLIGGTRTAILMLLEPVVGTVLAALLLREGIHPIQLLGGAGILVAAIVLQRAAASEDQPRPEAEPREPV